MLPELYEKLKETHKEEFQLIHDKKLIDAFMMLKLRDDPDSKFLTAVVYILLNKNKEALEKLLELEMNDFIKRGLIDGDRFYEIIGTCYFNQKNYLDAGRYFLMSLNINSENFYSAYNFANISIINKNYSKALEILEKLILKEPEDLILKRNIENLKKKLGK